MKIIKETSRNYLLADTQVSNIFIAEYLPGIRGDYVKVYLYAFMYSEIDHILTNDSIAEKLGLKVEDVLSAWKCFEDLHLIKKRYPVSSDKTRFDIIFVDLRESIFGKGVFSDEPENSGKNSLSDSGIKKVFEDVEKITGRPIPGNDFQKIGKMLETPGVEPALITFAYSYCANRGKPVSAQYVSKIVSAWVNDGISTEREAVEYLSSQDVRYDCYKKIMKALGLFAGNITDAVKKVFDSWLDDYGLSLNEIIALSEKGAGMHNKFSYLKKVIQDDYVKKTKKTEDGKEAGPIKRNKISRKKYYEDCRKKNENALNQRIKEINTKVPEMSTLEAEIKSLNMESVSASLSRADNREAEIKKIDKQIDKKTQQKKELLEAKGFHISDMEIQYSCSLCKDTGLLDNGSSCSCYNDATK